MTWVLIIWSALILIWAIGGGASNDCASEPTQLEQDACEAGTGLGVALILFIGFIGFVFLSLIWLMTRPSGRDCPVCGEKVKKGQTKCPSCAHDFAAAAGVKGDETAQAGTKPAALPEGPRIPEGWFPDPQDGGKERYWNGSNWTDAVRARG
jgi:hypothetical protein